ncbi:MAG: hypothetical protein VX252_17565 [Myxococcota bacterium]|nr:hypothetical protein [Myxococcota bacterium]
MKRPSSTRQRSRISILAFALLLLLLGAASAQDNPNSDITHDELGIVLRVPVLFSEGEWRTLSPPDIIHCRPPKTRPDPVLPAKIEILDSNRNVLNRRLIDDPRAYLPEDPRVPWSRAHKAELVLEIELVGNPDVLEFTDDFENRNGPSLSLDLTEAIQDLNINGAKRLPNCEQTNPPFVAVRGRNFFVLEYALKFAAENSNLTEGQILAILEREGRRGISRMLMREAVRELLLESLHNRN